MIDLEPLETWYDTGHGVQVPLPMELATRYGQLSFPLHPGRPYVIGNFVTTLDGVASLGAPGKEGGDEISGNNRPDQMIMGLLRAVSDAVVVGAGTLRATPQRFWTADDVFPSLANTFRDLRTSLRKSESPLNVFVTAHGEIDLSLPVFQSGKVPVMIVTSLAGSKRLAKAKLPPWVQIGTARSEDSIPAREILHAVAESSHKELELILVEGGPQLMGTLYAERVLDELFLTLAPQVAGRDDSTKRPGFVAGQSLAPASPTWGTLIGAKRAANHLFLRYSFQVTTE
jgi:riboflavin biosynthesis pyrimidine reductase